MGKDLEIGVPRNVQGYENKKVRTGLLGAKHDNMPELILEKDNEQLDKGLLKLNCEKLVSELRAQFADHTGLAINRTNSQPQIKASEAPNGPSMVSEFKDKSTSDPKELPSLDLSLKRLTEAEHIGSPTHGERNILEHSDLSAFSRYNTASAANQAPIGNVGSNRQNARSKDTNLGGTNPENDVGLTGKRGVGGASGSGSGSGVDQQN